MKLINKEDDISLTLLHFLQNSFQTFLKLASVLGSRNKRAHVQRENLLILQAFRHITGNDPLSKALYCGGFANAGLADQNRIILSLTGQDPDNIADLRVTSDHRIQLLVPGFLHQILAVFVQSIISSFRIIADNPLVAPHCGQRLKKTFPRNTKFRENLLHTWTWLLQQGQEQMLHRNILVSHGSGFVFRVHKRLVQILSEPQISSGHLHLGVQGCFYCI